MPLLLELPDAINSQLAERAMLEGKTVPSFALEMIARGLGRERTLDEILAPFRQSVAESGLSEKELEEFFEEVREEVWQEKEGLGK